MWYTLGYANTLICAPTHGGRAGYARDRSPVPVRLYGPPLPDASGQCRGAADDRHCAPATLYRSDRPPCHSCLSPARSSGAAAALVAASHHVNHLRRWDLRVPPGAVAPESADICQAHQPLDPPAGCRGQFRPGPYAAPGQRRNHSPRAAPVGDLLEAGQALADQSRSGLCAEKKPARPSDPAGDGAAHVGLGL
jgi:hypothetical protein